MPRRIKEPNQMDVTEQQISTDVYIIQMPPLKRRNQGDRLRQTKLDQTRKPHAPSSSGPNNLLALSSPLLSQLVLHIQNSTNAVVQLHISQ